jgi:hypothetical protein
MATGPAEHNPFRDGTHAAETDEALPQETEQDQPLDEGPSGDNRPVGEHTAKGRPPLMEK